MAASPLAVKVRSRGHKHVIMRIRLFGENPMHGKCNHIILSSRFSFTSVNRLNKLIREFCRTGVFSINKLFLLIVKTYEKQTNYCSFNFSYLLGSVLLWL